MRIEIRQILTMKLNEATCHLLMMGNVYILLDCGISPSFDFQVYRTHEQLIKKVSIILISHPSIQYLGALPFILSQFKINPQIFTTKPISQLGPINIHEALLYLRHPKYTPDIYIKICNMFQQTSIKPLQKKVFRINNQTDKTQQSADSISLICYNIGNTIGSVCWKISYFMFNCLYLIGYNNYSEYHLLGMDVETIISQKIDLVITDCYEDQKDQKDRQGLRKQILKRQIQQKYKFALSKGKERIIFSCYQNQRIIQLACVLIQLHKEKKIQGKIDFIHIQSLYLQSVRIYPELEYKMNEEDETIFNTRFINDRKFQSKTILTTSRSLQPQGLLWAQLCQQQPAKTCIIRVGKYNFINLIQSKINELVQLFEPEPLPEEVVEMIVQQVQVEQIPDNQTTNEEGGDNDLKQIRSDPYIYNNGAFPKFKLKKTVTEYDDYGQQYQLIQQNYNQVVVEEEQVAPQLQRKKSSLEERKRILFDLPPLNNIDFLRYEDHNTVRFNQNVTNFQSSINILTKIKAQKNVFINCDNKDFSKYQNRFRMTDKKIQVYGMHKRPIFYYQKPYEVIDLPVKLYKQPGEQFKNDNMSLSDIQAVKVDGQLVQMGSQLEIRLHKGQQKQLKDFNIAKFYKNIKKNGYNTSFSENGAVQIDGIKLSLKKGEVFLDGMYSKQYFELRQMLYDYIESS